MSNVSPLYYLVVVSFHDACSGCILHRRRYKNQRDAFKFAVSFYNGYHVRIYECYDQPGICILDVAD